MIRRHEYYAKRTAESVERAERRRPEMRMGQLIANLATLARGPAVDPLDAEDEELLDAARRQAEAFHARHARVAQPRNVAGFAASPSRGSGFVLDIWGKRRHARLREAIGGLEGREGGIWAQLDGHESPHRHRERESLPLGKRAQPQSNHRHPHTLRRRGGQGSGHHVGRQARHPEPRGGYYSAASGLRFRKGQRSVWNHHCPSKLHHARTG